MLVVTEKPSVAKMVRSAIKPTPPIIALKGHVLELDFPERYSNWRNIDPCELFSAPVEWKIRDPETYRSLVGAIKGVDMLVLATDNDPEGELIAYEVLLIAKKVLGATPRYGRMRFNATTVSELRRAWNNIESDLKWNWVWKALLRHKFDLITGAAYTRLLTLSKRLGGNNNLISWGSCVKGNTIIPGEYKPIDEINVGEHCIGWLLNNNEVIRKFARSYYGQIIRIKAAGLLPIELTPEHPVLTAMYSSQGSFPQLTWRRSEELAQRNKSGYKDYLVVPRIKGSVAAERILLGEFTREDGSGSIGEESIFLPLNEYVSWFIGVYVANGHVSGDNAFIYLKDECLENACRAADSIKDLGCAFSITRKENRIIAKLGSKCLCEALIRWCGGKPEDKRIPDFILLHRNLNLVKAFFNGFMDGKRWKASHGNKQCFTFTTRSKVLALQLQLLCARLGYFLYLSVSNITGKAKPNNESPCSDIYVMRLKPDLNGASFKISDESILTPIRKVEAAQYFGTVYNLETADNTYLVSNAVVHNCQMPTLWFIYKRESEIRNFKPEKYYVVSAVLNVYGTKVKVSSEPFKDPVKALYLYSVAENAKYAIVAGFQLRDEIEYKPLPTDTDVMLQELSKIMGLGAAKIMSIAENLYGNGYISYPRTETNMWLSVDHKAVLSMLSSTPLARYVNMLSYNPRDGRKNDGAHPPIYPTAYYPDKLDEKYRVWEYVARRYLANVVGKDAILRRWRLAVSLGGVQMSETGKYFVEEGFYQIFPYFKPKDIVWIPELHIGEKLPVIKVNLEEKKTKPPPRLTESELLKLLEEHSIGTDATRADYPQIIVERGYAEKKKKSFYISNLGETLINLLREVDERLVSPDTRRYVEHLMAEVEAGNVDLERALQEALKIYKDLFEKVSIKLRSGETNSINR
ncbi:MAG: DNA topoisomerase [Candidatus Bathyarchaeia archaeon]